MKKALLYRKLKNSVKCEVCARGCIIPEGQVGFCRVRKNVKGILYSLSYGKICSSAIDPIEKKPLYMFAPGSRVFSISTMGCNFNCQFCCNYSISQGWQKISGEKFTPEDIVGLAKNYNCQGISYTYTEPTVQFEFAYETAKLASKNGLYNMFVTNGFTTPKAIKRISKYLDAVTVDFKGSANPEFYKKFSSVPTVKPIFDALLAYKENKIYFEITDLLVPKFGDDLEDFRKLCKWIVENLGEATPMHVLQFFPTFKMLNLPRTPIETLEKAYEIGKKEGLKYVYLGNVSHKYGNTYCHNCGTLAVERSIMGVTKFNLKKDLKCQKCGIKIPIFGTEWVPEGLWK
ncbi:MAG: AmmeMemoRadiSam system radical SAM enzyme [Candidatus Aenigmatarchaeota archaeon]